MPNQLRRPNHRQLFPVDRYSAAVSPYSGPRRLSTLEMGACCDCCMSEVIDVEENHLTKERNIQPTVESNCDSRREFSSKTLLISELMAIRVMQFWTSNTRKSPTRLIYHLFAVALIRNIY